MLDVVDESDYLDICAEYYIKIYQHIQYTNLFVYKHLMLAYISSLRKIIGEQLLLNIFYLNKTCYRIFRCVLFVDSEL